MSALKIGALFAGYGGLDMAVMDVLDAELAWYAEFADAPSLILAHHHPGLVNHRDVTTVDWAAVEPVDVITGGSPCQDLSTAGKRAGMTSGTRSNLWVAMREAITTIKPRLVVWENVRGAGSAEATSALEQCPGCVGDPRNRGPALRALGRVVGDLADIGYVGRVYGLRASDVGAAHGRFRYFLIASPADTAGAGAADAIPAGGLPLQHRGVGGSLPRGDVAPDVADDRWGAYGPTLQRWAGVVGRPAPDPVDFAADKPRVSAHFNEWLMGLPSGWVTDVDGLTHEERLKVIGNGVVWQQAAAALRAYLRDEQIVAGDDAP